MLAYVSALDCEVNKWWGKDEKYKVCKVWAGGSKQMSRQAGKNKFIIHRFPFYPPAFPP